MRVAFDTSPLVRPYPFGVRRATRGLFDALCQSGVLDLVPVAPAVGESERSWRHRRLPGLLAGMNCAGLHSPISAFPHRGPGRRVQTVHELPWRHDVKENAGLSHRFWAAFGPWRADAVLCPTEFVRDDLAAESRHGQSRLHACPWGIEADFVGAPVDAEAKAELVQRLHLPAPGFVLALGANRAKKNLAACLRALAHSAQLGEVDLVVTGESTPALERDLERAAQLGVRQRVHHAGVVEADDLPKLISAAGVVVALSHSEGFGFPVLEALGRGTPVVVKANSAQAEVAGEVGLQVDPFDAQQVSDALSTALCTGEALRTRLLTRAAEFSWRRCARLVEEIWMQWAS